MTTEQVTFFGLGEDTLYYDERKKRFVSSKNAPEYVNRSFRHSHFKEVSRQSTDSDSNDRICTDNKRKSST